MKKIISCLLMAVILLGPVYAGQNEQLWTDGWSVPERLGESIYDARRPEFPQVRFQDMFLYLFVDRQDRQLKLGVYNPQLEDPAQSIDLPTGDMEIQVFDLAVQGDLIHIVWTAFWELERQIYHVILDQDLNIIQYPEMLYSTYRTVNRVMIAPGDSADYIFWSELTSKGYELFVGSSQVLDDRGWIYPQTIEEFGTPAIPHAQYVDEQGYVHLLWNRTDRIRGGRILSYSLFSPELTLINTTELGDTSLQENASGEMVEIDGVIHIVWTQILRGSFGGRDPISVRYQTFHQGQPQDDAIWLTQEPTSQPSIAADSQGNLRMVWSQHAGDKGGLEVFRGDIENGQLVNKDRLTWSTHQFVMPKLFIQDNYEWILFQLVSGGTRTLLSMNNQFPNEPGLWQRLGFDPMDVGTSMVYKLGEAFLFAGVYALLASATVLIVTGIIYLLHKKMGSPRKMSTFVLQLFLVCVLIFLQLSVFNFVNLQPVFVHGIYQLYLFVAISIIVTALFSYLGRGNKDEPTVYSGAAYLWLFLWFFMTAISEIPYVLM